MAYEILFAEGFGIDETGTAAIPRKYPGNTGEIFDSSYGRALVNPRTTQTGVRFGYQYGSSLGALFTQYKALTFCYYAYDFDSGVAIANHAPYFAVGTNSVLASIYYPYNGTVVLTLYGLIRSIPGFPTSGRHHVEVTVKGNTAGSNVLATSTLRIDGEVLGTLEGGSIPSNLAIRFSLSPHPNQPPIFQGLQHIVVAASDDPEFYLGPTNVTPFDPATTITAGAFTNSGSEPATENPKYLRATLDTGTYIQATGTTSATYGTTAIGVPPDATIHAVAVSMTAETDSTEQATIVMPNGTLGAPVIGAKATVTSIQQAPIAMQMGVKTSEVQGQVVFESPYSGNWTVPTGVTEISAVCVSAGASPSWSSSGGWARATGGAGGGLVYRNAIPVTPGESLQINLTDSVFGQCGITRAGVNLLAVKNAGAGIPGTPVASIAGQVGFTGGAPGSPNMNVTSGYTCGGAGGAAGYTGNGGNGADAPNPPDTVNNSVAAPANSGAGSGGAGLNGPDLTNNGLNGLNGGGSVGLLGIGETGGPSSAYGNPGSGGQPNGRKYGGGSASIYTNGIAGLRIIWGAGRSFPNNAGDV